MTFKALSSLGEINMSLLFATLTTYPIVWWVLDITISCKKPKKTKGRHYLHFIRCENWGSEKFSKYVNSIKNKQQRKDLKLDELPNPGTTLPTIYLPKLISLSTVMLNHYDVSQTNHVCLCLSLEFFSILFKDDSLLKAHF